MIEYSFHDVRKSFKEALQACEASGGTLPRPNSPDRQQELTEFLKKWYLDVVLEQINVSCNRVISSKWDYYFWHVLTHRDLILRLYFNEPIKVLVTLVVILVM